VPLSDPVKKLTTHKPFPIVGDTPLRTPKLIPRPAPFFVLQFCIQLIYNTWKCWLQCSILIANQRTKNGEAWELGYNKPSSNNLLGAILYKYHSGAYFHTFVPISWPCDLCCSSWMEMDRWFLDLHVVCLLLLHAWLEIRHRAEIFPNLV